MPITRIIPITMAKPSLSLILTISLVFFFVIAYSAAPVRGLGGGKVGGRTKITDVETNKEVQDLGKYSVNEYNLRQHKKGGSENGGGDLKFRKVVEAEKQVVSGIRYYLKIAATTSGGTAATFEAEVVVQPWKKSKQLLHFAPSPITK